MTDKQIKSYFYDVIRPEPTHRRELEHQNGKRGFSFEILNRLFDRFSPNQEWMV